MTFEEAAAQLLSVNFEQLRVFLDSGSWYIQLDGQIPLSATNRLDAQTEAAAWLLANRNKRVISTWHFSGADENGSGAIYA